LKRRVLLLGLGGAPLLARAGAQLEEPLADAIRSALSASIAQSAPPRPKFEPNQVDARMAYLLWLGEMSERLKKRKTETQIRIEFLETVWYEAKRAGLEPSLVLGLIQVESGFRKYAISIAGARGYMRWRCVATLSHADQSALRLRHPAPLPRHREGRSVSGARALQRQPRTSRVPQRRLCRAAAVAAARRALRLGIFPRRP
jgi:hypothetical protein